jgi:acylphosphatase
VGFRRFVQRVASGLGLRGRVRNLPDGSVEVLAWGNQAAIDQLEARLNVGPTKAYVTKVEKNEISDEIVAPSVFSVDS